MRRSAFLFAGVVLVATTVFGGGNGSVQRSARRIPGRYIVVLGSNADTAGVSNTVRGLKGGRVHHIYERGFKGLSVEISDADAQSLARDPRVKFVEEDATFSTATTWGLDRVDQRSLPLNGGHASSGTGAGVKVYVVDTGILATHEDFGGRVAPGFNAFNDDIGSTDCNGHGTHVAGAIAGSNYGVAKSATLVPVRVLNCNGSGSLATLLAGLDWVMQDHMQSPGPAVVNMSLSGFASQALDDQVNNVLAAGMTTVVAAGNDNADACAKSPSRVAGAITVGASTENDERASFSNYGTCVDVFAPGVNILSDSYSSTAATAVSSGTSQSAPFVAGVAALCLEKYPTATPSTVAQTVVSQATADALSGVGTGSPNRLVYSFIDTLDQYIGDEQLLGDPSFDYGTTFWTSDICTIINQSGCPPLLGFIDALIDINSFPSHGGNRHATIGGPAKSFRLTSENITIPSSVRKAELSFYLWVVTKGKKPSADDILTVEVLDASGRVIETLATYSNLDANATYTQRRFDVTRFRGMSMRIGFTGTQSQGPPTYFLLDDVAVHIWR